MILVLTARTEIPTNSVARITDIQNSVVAAFLDCGDRKAGTPFEIASVPVMAAQPRANAFSISASPRFSTALIGLGAGGAALRCQWKSTGPNSPKKISA